MTQDELKQAVAEAALAYVVEGKIVGVGTGSTARLFIEALATMKDRIAGAVASSEDTKRRLEGHGIKVFDLSGAFRVEQEGFYDHYYGFAHNQPEWLEKAVYGLAEWNEEAIAQAELVGPYNLTPGGLA